MELNEPILIHWIDWDLLSRLGVAAVLAEIFLAIGFWVERLRGKALAVGIALHLSIIPTMGDVVELTVFAGLLFSIYIVFLGRAGYAGNTVEAGSGG